MDNALGEGQVGEGVGVGDCKANDAYGRKYSRERLRRINFEAC